MKKISIITLGCKVNQYETSCIAKELEENNFNVVFSLEEADAYVVATCAVTNEAERKSRGILTKIKKVNPNAKIYICGCSSQNDHKKFIQENVKAIYGTSSKQNIAKHIIDDFKRGNETNSTIIDTQISSIYQENKFYSKAERTRVAIKIQEGCNNFCSYCLIPYLRGRERSRSLESVKNEIDFHSKTVKEIIFTGINMTNYGKDFNNGTSLKDIVLLMKNYPHIRFRFSSLEQDIITEDFLKTLSESSNFAPHFHLSLQSGCDNTLKSMNRKYLTNDYYNKLSLIRKYFDNPSLTTDIIVGFPTETEDDFINTYNFAKKCKFAKIHVFPFSLRSGTLASRMKNIATNVKERAHKLGELDKELQKEYITSCIGKNYTVIIEREVDGFYEGHTENYIKCYLKNDTKLNQNDIVTVEILEFFKDGAMVKNTTY